MSEEVKNEVAEVDADVAFVMAVCGDAERTRKLAAWMDALVEECVANQADLVESYDEAIDRKVRSLADRISAYRRIKDATSRALRRLSGQPPAAALADTAGGFL